VTKTGSGIVQRHEAVEEIRAVSTAIYGWNGLAVENRRNRCCQRQQTSPTLCCRVLPPGELNDMVLEPLLVYSESIVVITACNRFLMSVIKSGPLEHCHNL